MLAVAALCMASCERVPLLAPTGSTITLVSSATVLPTNGQTQIIAQVLEAAGTPPHSGTHVTFTTTMGRVVPSDIETDVSGRGIVTFFAGEANGTATISAISGGARTGTDQAVKIAVGTAAVGHVYLSANPTSVAANGGTTALTATVVDQNSNPLPSVAVNFTTTAGSLGSLLVMTNAAGVATTTLTTGQQATVTASVGAQGAPGGGSGTTTGTGGTTTTTNTSTQTSASITINVLTAPAIAITVPTNISVGIPATFTFTVTPAAQNGAPIRSVIVNWGDGRTDSLGTPTGAQTATHTYNSDGAFSVTATVTDANGSTTPVSAPIVVLPRVHPTVSVSANPSSILLNSTTSGSAAVNFTITISNPAAGILDATIDYDDGTVERFSTTSTVTRAHTYTFATMGSRTFANVVVTVVDRADGNTTSSSTTVVINH